ncbi:MAG: hypothetical protein FWF03_08450 [Defluviitaleaceae bacterium]|nr:hypothetical protein [Defluviitaleaceae bacterium]
MVYKRLFGETGIFANSIKNAELFMTDSGIKYLITPPEIGPEGRQGAAAATQSNTVSEKYRHFALNANISDETLIRVLQIFDAVSFDPELYVMVNHGFEGVDFEWGGEPYESAILPYPMVLEPTELFSTFIQDGNAGKEIYLFPSDVFYKYASGPGAALILYPNKTDPDGVYADEREALNALYPFADLNKKCLQQIADDFYKSVVTGAKDVRLEWDAYIAELNANGLREWNEYFNKLPVTNR